MDKAQATALAANLEAIRDEVRSRCSDSAYLKLAGAVEALEAVEDVASAPGGAVDVDALANAVAERLGVEVSSAVGEAFDARAIPLAGA